MDWFLYDGDLAAFQFNRRMFVKFVRYITHSERNKTDTKQLIRNERFMQLQYRLLFFYYFHGNRTPVLWKRVNLSMNTGSLERFLFSINTSAEAMPWKLQYCYFVIQRSLLFTQTKHVLILHFLALIMFDLVFTESNALRRTLLQVGTFWTFLNKFSGAVTKETCQNEFYECFSIILEKYLKFHFVSKVAGRIFLRMNFFIDTFKKYF